jgi:acetyl-CoA synthetase
MKGFTPVAQNNVASYLIPTLTAAPGINVPNVGLSNSMWLGIDSYQNTPTQVLTTPMPNVRVPTVLAVNPPKVRPEASARTDQPYQVRAAAVVSQIDETPQMISEAKVFGPHPAGATADETLAIRNLAHYNEMHRRSLENPRKFWRGIAENDFDWFHVGDHVLTHSFKNDVDVRWFKDWTTNLCHNALDRHVENGRGDVTALTWVGNDPGVKRTFTYNQLLTEVKKFANVLKTRGVKKGDTVTIYMPMAPEAVIAMLACVRIGAVHSVVFAAFSSSALRDRILDAKSKVLITANGYPRGARVHSDLKDKADKAMKDCEEEGNPVKTCVVLGRLEDTETKMQDGRDVWWSDSMKGVSDDCPCEEMNAEAPLFILYTSGSTGKPKGILHTTGGYQVYAGTTSKYIFNLTEPGRVHFCTADIGWITGHSYIVYGPMLNGANTIMYEGLPAHPDAGRFWEIADDLGVYSLYTAPTAINALKADGDEFVTKYKRSSIDILGTVGEPIKPDVWKWYHDVVGEGKRSVVDTYWQTETGGIIITPLPGVTGMKPGSATLPFFGIKPIVIRADGTEALPGEEGDLVIAGPWPGMVRQIWGKNGHSRLVNTYFKEHEGAYFTGDSAIRDEDGYTWILGRKDDVINNSGHRLGSGELEAPVVAVDGVSGAAAVGYPHKDVGQGIYIFATLEEGVKPSDEMKKKIVASMRKGIGPTATPDAIQFVKGLPLTRSGKIMRRFLKAIAAGTVSSSHEIREKFDTSTLTDPTVLDDAIKGWQEPPRLDTGKY